MLSSLCFCRKPECHHKIHFFDIQMFWAVQCYEAANTDDFFLPILCLKKEYKFFFADSNSFRPNSTRASWTQTSLHHFLFLFPYIYHFCLLPWNSTIFFGPGIYWRIYFLLLKILYKCKLYSPFCVNRFWVSSILYEKHNNKLLIVFLCICAPVENLTG